MPIILLGPDDDMTEVTKALLDLAGEDGYVQLRTGHPSTAFEVDEDTYEAWTKQHPDAGDDGDDDDGKATKSTGKRPTKSTNRTATK